MKFLHVESWLLDFNLTFRGNPRETMADAAGDVLDGPFRPCASLGALHKVPHVARIVFDFLFKKPAPKWVALVSGNMDQNLRHPSCLILSHTHIYSCMGSLIPH